MLSDLIAQTGCFAALTRQFLKGQLLGKEKCEEDLTQMQQILASECSVFQGELNHEDLLNLA